MLNHNIKLLIRAFVLLLTFDTFAGSIELLDDVGRSVRLDSPAKRIISLAPHITENLFAAGVGDLLVGVVSYSNFPEQALSIPQVGSYNNINVELILALQADLVIAWKEGNQKQQVEKLIDLGLTVYINAPIELEDIARNIRDFGMLTGKIKNATQASNDFTQRLNEFRHKYSNQEEISVFYQTWHKPLLTVNKRQFIGRIITLCSGRNIFAELSALTPQVNIEAVLAHNPRVIIASGMGEARPEWLNDWKQWSFLDAVKQDNLFYVPPDIIQRHSPRILDGAQMICEHLARIRRGF